MVKKPVTSIDVAKAAGVSQPTVSRAYDENSSVAPATRARILEVAKELSYNPNVIARGLSKQKTDIIGIVMANLTVSLFYPEVLEKFTTRLQQMGKQVLLFTVSAEHSSVDEILPRVLGYQVDALIITSTMPGSEIIEESTRVGRPIILINRLAPGTSANAVCCDNVDGGRIVADFLLDAGHKKITYLAGVEYSSTNSMREQGFTRRLRERGFTNVSLEQGDYYSYDSGCEAARRLLDTDDPPDAIFCAADILALGLLDTAKYELGIKVPEDLSVIGFDDIPVARMPAFDLTTIRQPVDEMVEAVAELLSRPDGESPIGETILLPGELMIRGSAKVPSGD
ncbi:MAG: LacI family DNA-binding transcriptional regulator [Anaerolineae bacterium]|nr:LacI family DNA-binding transcriptional regulator [Anaerolineae bacterium]MDK1080031.1 LacI family DNA-binding transcriptional regulator [Anaerolineae bacterium]MDK1118113.1 LacI family DNA-binding transcriptional regulator [Anaerolineae bacterium]